MKIKFDFVTNSSSTAYLIIVPSQIKLLHSSDEMEKTNTYDEEYHFQADDNKQFVIDEVNRNLTMLEQGKTIYAENIYAFFLTKDILLKRGCVLEEIDMSGNSGMDIMKPIRLKDIHKQLDRIQKNENKK